MSVVVRMEMPKNCLNCDLRYECNALLMLERKQPLVGADSSKDRYRYMQWLVDFNAIRDAKTIVPAERSET